MAVKKRACGQSCVMEVMERDEANRYYVTTVSFRGFYHYLLQKLHIHLAQ